MIRWNACCCITETFCRHGWSWEKNFLFLLLWIGARFVWNIVGDAFFSSSVPRRGNAYEISMCAAHGGMHAKIFLRIATERKGHATNIAGRRMTLHVGNSGIYFSAETKSRGLEKWEPSLRNLETAFAGISVQHMFWVIVSQIIVHCTCCPLCGMIDEIVIGHSKLV